MPLINSTRSMSMRCGCRSVVRGVRQSNTDDVAPEDVEPVKRCQRTPNVARYIRQARKAGDRGPVRVEITDAKGRTVTVTSEQGQAQQWMQRATCGTKTCALVRPPTLLLVERQQ
jgi:hypothetical protein